MEEEIWKDIEGYDGDYQISSHGRVRSFKQNKPRMIKTVLNRGGYVHCSLWKNNKGRNHRVHRLVGKAFVENPENKGDINHLDGDKTNNYYKNIEWATRSENIQHAFDNDLNRKGKRHAYSKTVKDLTTGEIYDSIVEASNEVGLIEETISKHCNGRRKKQKFKFINQ